MRITQPLLKRITQPLLMRITQTLLMCITQTLRMHITQPLLMCIAQPLLMRITTPTDAHHTNPTNAHHTNPTDAPSKCSRTQYCPGQSASRQSGTDRNAIQGLQDAAFASPRNCQPLAVTPNILQWSIFSRLILYNTSTLARLSLLGLMIVSATLIM